MKIYNLKDKIEYLDEVVKLEYEEWADNNKENKQLRIATKKEKIMPLLVYKIIILQDTYVIW
mgnify:CR=1 FL=1